MTWRRLAVVAVTGMLAAGCAGGGPTDHEAVHYVVDHLAARADAAGGGERWYRTLADVLPATSFVTSDGTVHRASPTFVVGTVVGVEEGAGFVVPGGDAPSGVRVAFDHRGALWRTAHLVVDVERAFGQRVGDEVRVGVAFDGSAEAGTMLQGLGALGRVAVPLFRSPVFAYDRGVHGIVEDAALLATVDSTGRLALPALDDERERTMLAGTETVERLSAAAGRARTLQVNGG